MQLELPRKLVELSLNSMHNAKGRRFQPYDACFLEALTQSPQNNEPTKLNGKAFSTLLTPLRRVEDGTPVVAIDVSSIRLGETETGIIFAVRGTIVWRQNRRYRYVRIGPFPFHMTEENQREIFDTLEQHPPSRLHNGTSMPLEAQSRLCNIAERWIQTNVANSTSNSIILWDGSMTAGTPGSPVSAVSRILKVARRNSDSVLAFSKATSIKFLGLRITDLVLRQRPPCLLEVEDLPVSISKNTHLLGRIYVANLARGGCSFRLDVDRTIAPEQGITAVERLLGNETVFQGYPESLRLAHIYSTFTANDVLGIQSLITREYGLRVIARPSIRKRLFGPFGTGFED